MADAFERNYGAHGVNVNSEEEEFETIGSKIADPSIVLAQGFIDECVKVVAGGANPVLISKGIEKTSNALVHELNLIMSKGSNAPNDSEAESMIAEAISKVRRKGVAVNDEGRMQFNKPINANDIDRSTLDNGLGLDPAVIFGAEDFEPESSATVLVNKGAVDESIVVGGGCTLLSLAAKVDSIKNTLENEEEKVGADIVKKGLSNAGVDGSLVSEKVVRGSLEHAASAAKTFLMSEIKVPEAGNPMDVSGWLLR